MDKDCSNCKYGCSTEEEICAPCLEGLVNNWEWFGVIFLPKLNGLTPSIDSCTMKLIEELGELLQLIGKGNQASGEPKADLDISPERVISEAFDVAQSAVTMIHTISQKYGIDIFEQLELHEQKLRKKGYLK